MRPWLQLAVTLVVAASLLAAPCKNCQPKAQAPADHCGHDCCPKPKPSPQPAPPCSWQPAAFDAVEPDAAKAGISDGHPAILPAITVIELPAGELLNAQPLPIAPPPSPPTLLNLRI